MNAQLLLEFTIKDKARARLSADIFDEKLDRFSGELCFNPDMDWDFKLAAELFDGKFEYPEDLENNGFKTNRNIEAKAAFRYQRLDGSYGIAVRYTQKIWEGTYGKGKFSVVDIKGCIKYTGTDKKYAFGLEGKFSMGEYSAGASLSLGSTKDVPTVLKLTYEHNANDADAISLPNFIDSISDSVGYNALEVPSDFTRPSSAFKLNAVLNLTEKTFFLAGKYQFESGAHASAVLYFSKQEQKYEWWMGISIQMRDSSQPDSSASDSTLSSFSLSDISSALEDVERFLGLKDMKATVILSSAVLKIQEIQKIQKIQQTEDIQETQGDVYIGNIEEIKAGLTFRIGLSLRDGFLKEVLRIEECSISGHIPRDKNGEIKLCGSGKRIEFLGFLILENIIVDLKKESGKPAFSFHAEGDIRWNFEKLNLPKARMKIYMEENAQKKEVILEGEVGEVENPLGIPATTLEELMFHASSVKYPDRDASKQQGISEKVNKFYFSGAVIIGELRLSAFIYFENRSPAVVVLKIDTEKKLSISSLADKYLGFKWTEILNIKLYDGKIWYNPTGETVSADAPDSDVPDSDTPGVYSPGFHAQVYTQISFLPPVKIDIGIDTDNKKRLQAAACFQDVVKFSFIKLYTKTGNEVHGPELSIDVTRSTKTFELKSCISIFDHDTGEVSIRARKESFELTYNFPDSLPIRGELTLVFDEKGVHIEKCPIFELDMLDIQLPETDFGSLSGSQCKIQIIKPPRVRVVPDIDSHGISFTSTELILTFDFIIRLRSEMSFGDGGEDIVTLLFKDKTISLGVDEVEVSEFSFKSFAKWIGSNVERLFKDMAKDVISGEVFSEVLTEEGMKKLIKFLLIEGGTWLVNEFVSYLVCQGLEELLADALAAAMTSATEKLWEGLGYVLALGGVLCTVIGGMVTVGQKLPNEDDPDKIPETPGIPTAWFENDMLIIEWDPCEGAEWYSPMVSRQPADNNERTDLVLGECKNLRLELEGRDEKDLCAASYGYTYYIKILAWNQYGTAIGGETSIYLLCRPTGINLHYLCEEKRLRITWDAVNRAEQYEVERWYGEEEEDKETRISYTNELTYDNLEPNRSVTIKLRGKTDGVIGPAAEPIEFYLYDLQAPSGIQAYGTDGGIVLEWAQVPYASGYHITCKENGNRDLDIPECGGTSLLIDAALLQENAGYTIGVRSMAKEIEGRLSEEVTVLWRLPPVPEIVELVCREDGLMVFVLMIDNVKSRQIVYPDGRVVVLDEQQIACEWSIEESARVRVLERARTGQWSEEISVRPLKAPQDMRLSLRDDKMCVEWKKTEENSIYGIEIWAGDCHRVEESIEGTSWQTDISKMPEEEIIRVCLYAIDRTDTRRRSVAVEESLDRRLHNLQK